MRNILPIGIFSNHKADFLFLSNIAEVSHHGDLFHLSHDSPCSSSQKRMVASLNMRMITTLIPVLDSDLHVVAEMLTSIILRTQFNK